MDADQVFPAPKIKRRIGAPKHVAIVLVLTAALPILVAAGLLGTKDGVSSAIHVLLVFVVLMAAFRILGKRELGRLSPFELVTLMLIPEVLSNTLQGQGSLVDGLAGLSTLFLLVVASSVLAHRFRWFERAVEAEPTILVAHGRIVEKALNAERILPDELLSEMRKQGLARLEDVDWAVLESSGNITFIPRPGADGTPRSSAEDSEVR
ncbi:MAG: DUF421 domain-containing protein [Myxococcota bacterium]|jgi:uncharacterized membrane protein YcaP (DUF421 family)|nr:DUF421 domain-containing protein [Myxococcota bacterium]